MAIVCGHMTIESPSSHIFSQEWKQAANSISVQHLDLRCKAPEIMKQSPTIGVREEAHSSRSSPVAAVSHTVGNG